MVIQAFTQEHARKEFVLLKPTSLDLPLFQRGQAIVHIAWSHTGTDLAVVDSWGGLFLFVSVLGQLNRLNFAGKYTPEQISVSSVVVGLEWLNITSNRPVYQCSFS